MRYVDNTLHNINEAVRSRYQICHIQTGVAKCKIPGGREFIAQFARK
jgi:hypothetical protein